MGAVVNMDLKQYRSKLVGSKDERAVSPVIGVILMVAITVILAAVIAAFVLDMGSNQQTNVNAAVQQDGSTVTLTDSGNADGVKFVVGGTVAQPSGGSSPMTLEDVGDSVDLTTSGDISAGDEVNVVAYQGSPSGSDNENVIQTITV